MKLFNSTVLITVVIAFTENYKLVYIMFSFYFNRVHIWSALGKVFGACNTSNKSDFTKVVVVKFNNAQNYMK